MKLSVGTSSALRFITITSTCLAISSSIQSCSQTDKNEPAPAAVANDVVVFSQPLSDKHYEFLPSVKVPGLTIISIKDKATDTVLNISKMDEKTGTALHNIMNRYQQDGLPVGEKDVLKFQTVDNFTMLIAGKSMMFLNAKIKPKTDPAAPNKPVTTASMLNAPPIMLSAIRTSPESVTNIYFTTKKQKIDMNAANDLCNNIVSFK